MQTRAEPARAEPLLRERASGRLRGTGCGERVLKLFRIGLRRRFPQLNDAADWSDGEDEDEPWAQAGTLRNAAPKVVATTPAPAAAGGSTRSAAGWSETISSDYGVPGGPPPRMRT